MAQEPAIKRYSEAFKLQVVQEYEAGASISHLQRKYKIGGSTTIQKWIKKYSNKGLRHSVVKVRAAKEADQESEKVEKLKARVARLEKAVSNLTVEKLLLESTIESYQEAYGMELSKKNGRKSSSKRIGKRKGS